MIRIDIPLRGIVELQHAVFDVNGTLAVDQGLCVLPKREG